MIRILLLLTILVVTIGRSQEVEVREDYYLNGKVKDIKEYRIPSYQHGFGEFEVSDSLPRKEYQFDQDGYLTIFKNFKANNTTPDYYEVFTYNARHLLTLYELPLSGNSSKKKYEYIIDSNQISKRTTYNWKGEIPFVRSIATYNDKSLIIREDHSIPDGRVMSYNEFKYDAKGNLIADFLFDHEVEGIVKSYGMFYQYDKKGNLIESIDVEFKGDSTIREKISREYDKKGRITHEIDWLSPNLTYETSKKYNKYGHVVEMVNTQIKNDKKKNDEYTFQYEYDKKKNWRVKKSYHQGKLVEVLVREINYFN